VLLPWVGVLVGTLPSEHRAAHWGVAWAGFDIASALLLLAVAGAARQRSFWFEGAATAAATLLFIDAWFDVLTSSTQAQLVVAIAEALLVELPLAGLCLRLAREAERRVRIQLFNRSAPARLRARRRATSGRVLRRRGSTQRLMLAALVDVPG